MYVLTALLLAILFLHLVFSVLRAILIFILLVSDQAWPLEVSVSLRSVIFTVIRLETFLKIVAFITIVLFSDFIALLSFCSFFFDVALS